MGSEKTKSTRKVHGGKKRRPSKGHDASRGNRNDIRDSFIRNLQDRKKELEAVLARMMDSQREHDAQLASGEYIDDLDDAQREISAHSQYILVARKIEELKKIDSLINKVSEKGEIGICEECGRPIPKERLLIIPEATLCVSCQKDLEKSGFKKSLSSKPAPEMGGGGFMKWMTSADGSDNDTEGKTWSLEDLTLSELEETETDEAVTVED
jgi:DnaK suppressor protein